MRMLRCPAVGDVVRQVGANEKRPSTAACSGTSGVELEEPTPAHRFATSTVTSSGASRMELGATWEKIGIADGRRIFYTVSCISPSGVGNPVQVRSGPATVILHGVGESQKTTPERVLGTLARGCQHAVHG